MGRKLMRVPFDFNHRLGEVWEGYSPSLEHMKSIKELVKEVPEILEYQGNVCEECDKKFNYCSESARYCVWHNHNLKRMWFKEVPKGEGYQLWETTSEGSPISPVFKTLDELCAWCVDNATTFSDYKATKEEWIKMLSEDFVYHKQGNCIFI